MHLAAQLSEKFLSVTYDAEIIDSGEIFGYRRIGMHSEKH